MFKGNLMFLTLMSQKVFINTEPVVQGKTITINNVEDYTNADKIYQIMIEKNANSIIIDINGGNDSTNGTLKSQRYYFLAEKIEIKGNHFKKIGYRCFANTNMLLTEVVVSNSVTEIEESAFKNSRIEKFQSDSITNAEESAFENCFYIKSISMNGLTKIPYSFAYNCFQLESVIMRSATEIESYAFYECLSLSQFEFGKVISFGVSCFQRTSLRKITIPRECTMIKASAFQFSLLESINFEVVDSNITLSPNAFSNTQLKSVEIPEKAIIQNIFQECFLLKNIKLPSSITNIPTYFAANCYSLETVTAPGVTTIEKQAFYFCKNLKSVTFGTVTYFGINSFAYCKELEYEITSTTKDSETPMTIEEKAFFYCKKVKASSIYCQRLDHYCFAGCQGITSLSIYTQGIGTSAFHYCSNLKNIKIYPITDNIIIEDNNSSIANSTEDMDNPGNETEGDNPSESNEKPISYFVIYPNAFCNCTNLEDIQFIRLDDLPIEHKIFEYAFAYTGEIKELDLSLFMQVSHHAFQSSKIKKVIIGDVDEFCFANCTYLTKIVVRNSSTKFDARAFSDCVNAKFEFPLLRSNIYIENGFIINDERIILSLSSFIKDEKITIPAQYSNISQNAFLFAKNLKEIVIENITFYITDSLSNIPSLKKISFPSKMLLNSIDYGSFQNDCLLEEIEIPSSIISIEDQVFYNCTSLKKISIPNKVNFIGKYAFYNCISLKSIVLPPSVKFIGSNAFERCISLKEIDLSMISELSKSILSQCTNLYSIKLSTSLISINGYAFQETSIKSFNIPDSVRSIGENIFYNCSYLKAVTIGKGITTLNNLFKLSSIKEFHIPSHITQINGKCFEAVPNIRVTIDKDHPVFYIKENFIIRKVDNAIICTFGELPKTIKIPDEIEQINSITLNRNWEKTNDGFGGEFYEDYSKLPNTVILPESFMNGIPNEILGIKLVCYKGAYLLGQDDGEISSSTEIWTEYDATDKYTSNKIFDKEILGQNCNSKNIILNSKWRHINGLSTLEIALIVISVLLFIVLIGLIIMFFGSLRKNKRNDSDSGFNQNQI